MYRKFGWRPNKIDNRDYLYSERFEPNLNLSLGSISPVEIKDQGADPNCVGQGWAGSLRKQELARALPRSKELSANYVYYNARIEVLRFKKLALLYLQNEGSSVRAGAMGIVKRGAAAEREWPTRTSTINKQPHMSAVISADSRAGGKFYSIPEKGSNRIDTTIQAIDNDHYPVGGAFVPESFLNNYNSGPIDVPKSYEKIIGGHAFYISGYYYTSQRELRFQLTNSWGTDWRINGIAPITPEFLNYCVDLTVMDEWRILA